jgi:molybdopterin molybdotransferase
MHKLITYNEALDRILNQFSSIRPKKVDLLGSLNHVLAEDIFADMDLPPFDRAVMDGFAVRFEETGFRQSDFRIIGESAAGKPYRGKIKNGECIRIMTGALVPENATSVVMEEKTEFINPETVRVSERIIPGQYIAKKGSECSKGQLVLNRGTEVSPRHIGVLAGFGKKEVRIFEPPKVGIFSTGDELVELDAYPGEGQIRDSNSYMLLAQCRNIGVTAERLGSLADNPEDTAEKINSAKDFNILLLTGGVSMGERDYVPGAIREAGFQVVFHKASVKPGKPILFGTNRDRLIFGLPGNPVSSFVTFHLFVKPAIRKMKGHQTTRPEFIQARLKSPATNRSKRQFFAPGTADWAWGCLQVNPVTTAGSADITAFSKANALIVIPAEVDEIPAGETAEVILLD